MSRTNTHTHTQFRSPQQELLEGGDRRPGSTSARIARLAPRPAPRDEVGRCLARCDGQVLAGDIRWGSDDLCRHDGLGRAGPARRIVGPTHLPSSRLRYRRFPAARLPPASHPPPAGRHATATHKTASQAAQPPTAGQPPATTTRSSRRRPTDPRSALRPQHAAGHFCFSCCSHADALENLVQPTVATTWGHLYRDKGHAARPLGPLPPAVKQPPSPNPLDRHPAHVGSPRPTHLTSKQAPANATSTGDVHASSRQALTSALA